MEAATRITPGHNVPGRVAGVDGADGAKAVFTGERMQQFSSGVEDLDPSRLSHTPHHKAVVALGVPFRSEPRQPAARIVVVPSQKWQERELLTGDSAPVSLVLGFIMITVP